MNLDGKNSFPKHKSAHKTDKSISFYINNNSHKHKNVSHYYMKKLKCNKMIMMWLTKELIYLGDTFEQKSVLLSVSTHTEYNFKKMLDGKIKNSKSTKVSKNGSWSLR